MASQMVVPASRDTLFMRGFSARRDIDEIRDFFSEEGGRCSVEFFKESDDKSKLYVALKFDNKDIAKELLNKYDNTEVLGDRITISWFKDLRRARFNANANRSRRSNWSPDRYDKYKSRYYSGNRYMPNRWTSSYGTRSRRYERSYSRSHSRSSSRSLSRSTSPRRSRSHSRSSDSYDDRRHRKRHSKKESRKSTDKRRSDERHSREHSGSMTRQSRDLSDEADDEVVDGKKEKSVERRSPVKVVYSAVRTVERQLKDDSHSENESSDAMSISEEDKSSNHSLDVPTRSSSQSVMKQVEKITADPPGVTRAERQKCPSSRECQPPDMESIDDMKERYFSPQRALDNSPLPPRGNRYSSEVYEQHFERNQEYGQSFKRTRRSPSPGTRKNEHLPVNIQDKDMAPPAKGGKVDSEYVHSPLNLRDGREVAYSDFRNLRQDSRYSEEHQKVISSMPAERTVQKQIPDIQSPREKESCTDIGRVQHTSDADGAPVFERKIVQRFDDFRAPTRKPVSCDELDKPQMFMESATCREIRQDFYDDAPRMDRVTGSKEQRKIPMDHSDTVANDYSQTPVERGMPPGDHIRGMRDNGSHLTERCQPSQDRAPQSLPSGGRMVAAHEWSPLFDDHESTESAQSAHRGSAPQAFNGGVIKEVEKGALGLSQDKMALVREKKDEIEKSYRQDCETFAAVTKMLISKDAWLEDKLQASLKENLKDIGQRCIHELREFIEALKSESGMIH